MSPHSQPLELHEHIIDHLHNDIHALRACSLTCQGWLPATRCVVLVRVSDCLRFLDALESSAQTHTRIADYVREFKLPDMSLMSRRRLRRNRWRFELLCRILRDLRNLTCLRVNGFDWEGFIHLLRAEAGDESLREAMAAFFPCPTLKKLFIESLELHSPDELTLLISIFPRLSWLDLSVLFKFRDSLPDNRSTSVNSQRAASSPAALARILESLLSPPFEGSFHEVIWMSKSLERRLVSDTHLLKEVLRKSETTLESLSVVLPDAEWLGDLDLSRHQRLTTLRFDFGFAADDMYFGALHVFYAELTSGHLRNVHMLFEVQDCPEDWAHVDWPHLDQTLAALHMRCPSLTITFEIFNGVHIDEVGLNVIQPLQERLTQTIAAGMRVEVMASAVVFCRSDDSGELVTVSDTL
ncbi:uncharacterized protein C8Q71DRAFT_866109 [Rhodofomes roseus]|uniref:F-box domain-containing protein n=1 Tax=Rhodofomes roseus TaxID=34475 RepID=A0ABQ8KY54_9APHY|nr:uncharacterized protein C8Q71DRAFT_866109 [Rhodofomes roseus]KAH9844141.1 hypothetical protein C8Q71DRAFT_866109 [Rhodofomes roseus]